MTFEDLTPAQRDSLKGDRGEPGPPGKPGPSGASTWEDVQDKPAVFPPASHTHRRADITDLPSLAEGNIEGSILVRGSTGHFYVRYPEQDGHPATKSYVDTAVTSEKARTVGMVWMVETESQAQAKESSCQKGDFIQVAATGNIYQVV